GDGLVERAAEMGRYLFAQRDRLLAHRTIADVRGTGLLMVLELVRDKANRGFFPQEAHAEEKFQTIALKNGIVFYMSLFGPRRPSAQTRGIPLFVSPPLIITRAQIDEMLDAIERTLEEWAREMGI